LLDKFVGQLFRDVEFGSSRWIARITTRKISLFLARILIILFAEFSAFEGILRAY
jgi:hypothetical protein